MSIEAPKTIDYFGSPQMVETIGRLGHGMILWAMQYHEAADEDARMVARANAEDAVLDAASAVQQRYPCPHHSEQERKSVVISLVDALLAAVAEARKE